jgi:hypothetical protein
MAWGISKRVEMSSCTLDEAEVAEDLKRDSSSVFLIKIWDGDWGKVVLI